jgi:hypothetical protein
MDLEKDDLRTALDDVRARHAAVVNLIYVTDGQALGLLRLYTTLGVGAASGAVAGLAGSPIVTRPLAFGLLAATVTLIAGAGFCLRALQSSRINLPGRTPDFWQWAMHEGVDRKAVLTAYLSNLQDKSVLNAEVNAKAANALKWAKRSAPASVVAALIASLLAASLMP